MWLLKELTARSWLSSEGSVAIETVKISKQQSTFIVGDLTYTYNNPGWTVFSELFSELLSPRLSIYGAPDSR
jgi:hypothetical protein